MYQKRIIIRKSIDCFHCCDYVCKCIYEWNGKILSRGRKETETFSNVSYYYDLIAKMPGACWQQLLHAHSYQKIDGLKAQKFFNAAHRASTTRAKLKDCSWKIIWGKKKAFRKCGKMKKLFERLDLRSQMEIDTKKARGAFKIVGAAALIGQSRRLLSLELCQCSNAEIYRCLGSSPPLNLGSSCNGRSLGWCSESKKS